MAASKSENGCAQCADLAAQIAALREQIRALEAELAKSRKHSGNSSKPPSSDIVEPRRKSGKGNRRKRKIGAQPGHDRQERAPFSPEELSEHWLWYYPQCPCCGGGLRDTEETGRTIQQIELPKMPVQITENTAKDNGVRPARRHLFQRCRMSCARPGWWDRD